MSVDRILFYQMTWGYLIVNILIAKFDSVTMLLIGIRESWMLILLVYLIINKRVESLLFLLIIGIYGFLPMIGNFSIMTFMGYIYGFRDIFLIVLLVEILLLNNTNITKKEITVFVLIIMLLSLLDILFTYFIGSGNLYSYFFDIDQYYKNKGVQTNISHGFFGDRVVIPLYSPNLLATLLATFYFLDRRVVKSDWKIKLLAFIVTVFTLSKVLLVSLFFYISGKRWKYNVVLMLFFIFPLYFVLVYFYNTLELGLLKYHVASILGHFASFGHVIELGFSSLLPDTLGSNSTAIKITSGEKSIGIESLLLTRLSELKIYFIFLIIYLIYMYRKVKLDASKKFIVYFIFIVTLTATSNQPIAFVPFLYYLIHYKKIYTQKEAN